MPQLEKQIIIDMLGLDQEVEELTNILSETLKRSSNAHANAIRREFQRREDKANAEQKQKDDAAAAKARR